MKLLDQLKQSIKHKIKIMLESILDKILDQLSNLNLLNRLRSLLEKSNKLSTKTEETEETVENNFEEEMVSVTSEILDYINQKKERTTNLYKENKYSYTKALKTWMLSPRDSDFTEILDKLLVVIQKQSVNVYIRNQFPEKLTNSFENDIEFARSIGMPGIDNSSYMDYLCLVKDNGIWNINEPASYMKPFNSSSRLNDYISGLYIYIIGDQFKIATAGISKGETWKAMDPETYSATIEKDIVRITQVGESVPTGIKKLKKSTFSSDYYLAKVDDPTKSTNPHEKHYLKLNNPDEWGSINNIINVFIKLNEIPTSSNIEIIKLREKFYNDVEIGITADLLISQIGEPANSRMVSQTKNTKKEYLFYDSFENQRGNTKYKKRFEIKNGELTGIKEDEFDG